MRLAIFLVLCSLTFSAVAQQQEENTQQESSESKPAEQEATQPKDQPAASGEQSSPIAEVAPPISVKSLHEHDANWQLSKEILSPMLVGTEDIITLTQPDALALNRGVAVLVPDWHQSVTSPKAINFLRNDLPQKGWTTITVQPPAKPDNYPSSASKASQRNTENEQTISSYKEAITPILQAVFNKAQEYPGVFVVISEGNNAAIIMDIVQQQQLPAPNGIVLLSAHMESQSDNLKFAQIMSESDTPVLDLVLSKDNRWAEHYAPIRKQHAKKALKTFYRQRQLQNTVTGYYPEKALASAFKSWLVSTGW